MGSRSDLLQRLSPKRGCGGLVGAQEGPPVVTELGKVSVGNGALPGSWDGVAEET